MYKKNRAKWRLNKGLGVFAVSPNLLIWQLKKKDNYKMQKIWLVAKPKGHRLPPALLFLY